MDTNLFWFDLDTAFGSQKVFWTKKERESKPDSTDRLIYYLISYYETPSVARRAIRLLTGIDRDEFDLVLFSNWNEVRVSSLNQIYQTLQKCGARGDSWDLAVSIRDFLENLWNTCHTLSLDEVEQADRPKYLDQLLGDITWGKQSTKEGKNKPCPTPFRPEFSIFHKHCAKYRKQGSRVLPDCAVTYIEYLWNRTSNAPFDIHANRILARMGIIHDQDTMGTKVSRYEDLITQKKGMTKHRHLVQLGKLVCHTETPRCSVCPVAKYCAKIGVINMC